MSDVAGIALSLGAPNVAIGKQPRYDAHHRSGKSSMQTRSMYRSQKPNQAATNQHLDNLKICVGAREVLVGLLRSHFVPTSFPHSAVLSLFFLVFLYLRPAPIGNQLLAETHVVAAMVDSNPYLQLVRLVRPLSAEHSSPVGVAELGLSSAKLPQ